MTCPIAQWDNTQGEASTKAREVFERRILLIQLFHPFNPRSKLADLLIHVDTYCECRIVEVSGV